MLVVSFDVVAEGVGREADDRAQVALVLVVLQTAVDVLVGPQLRVLPEAGVTQAARVRLLAGVDPLVLCQVSGVLELGRTLVALVRLLLAVHLFVTGAC